MRYTRTVVRKTSLCISVDMFQRFGKIAAPCIYIPKTEATVFIETFVSYLQGYTAPYLTRPRNEVHS